MLIDIKLEILSSHVIQMNIEWLCKILIEANACPNNKSNNLWIQCLIYQIGKEQRVSQRQMIESFVVGHNMSVNQKSLI